MTDQPGGKAFDTEYDTDFVAWAEAQAGALRAHKKGRNTIVDWENVAEEIESLGKSERRQLASHIATVIEHLTYLQASPAVSPSISLRRCVALCRRNVPPVVARLLPALRHKNSSPGPHWVIISGMTRLSAQQIISALGCWPSGPSLADCPRMG